MVSIHHRLRRGIIKTKQSKTTKEICFNAVKGPACILKGTRAHTVVNASPFASFQKKKTKKKKTKKKKQKTLCKHNAERALNRMNTVIEFSAARIVIQSNYRFVE